MLQEKEYNQETGRVWSIHSRSARITGWMTESEANDWLMKKLDEIRNKYTYDHGPHALAYVTKDGQLYAYFAYAS